MIMAIMMDLVLLWICEQGIAPLKTGAAIWVDRAASQLRMQRLS